MRIGVLSGAVGLDGPVAVTPNGAYDVQVAECIVGGIDPVTGDTIANCPPTGQNNVTVMEPAWCDTTHPVVGSCICPPGTALNPSTYMCVGATKSNLLLYGLAGLAVLLIVMRPK